MLDPLSGWASDPVIHIWSVAETHTASCGAGAERTVRSCTPECSAASRMDRSGSTTGRSRWLRRKTPGQSGDSHASRTSNWRRPALGLGLGLRRARSRPRSQASASADRRQPSFTVVPSRAGSAHVAWQARPRSAAACKWGQWNRACGGHDDARSEVDRASNAMGLDGRDRQGRDRSCSAADGHSAKAMIGSSGLAVLGVSAHATQRDLGECHGHERPGR